MVSGPFIEDRFLFWVLASRSFPWSALLIYITASDTWLSALNLILPAAFYSFHLLLDQSFFSVWDRRIACLPVDRVGVDPAKPAIPTEAYL